MMPPRWFLNRGSIKTISPMWSEFYFLCHTKLCLIIFISICRRSVTNQAVENPKPGGWYAHIVKERLKIAVRFQHSFCYHDAILFMVAFLCAAFVLRNSTGGSFWFEYATLGFDSHSAWDSRLDLFNMQLRWLPFLQLYKQFHFQLIFLNLFLPTESYRTYAVQVRILCSFVQTQEVKRSSYQAAYGRSAIPVSSLWSGIF